MTRIQNTLVNPINMLAESAYRHIEKGRYKTARICLQRAERARLDSLGKISANPSEEELSGGVAVKDKLDRAWRYLNIKEKENFAEELK